MYIDNQDKFVIKTVLEEAIEKSKKALEENPESVLRGGAQMWVQAMERALEHFDNQTGSA